MSKLTCKTIYTKDSGVCIYNTDFPKYRAEIKDSVTGKPVSKRVYKIPELNDLIIDEVSYRMFVTSGDRYFYAVKTATPNLYSLKPLSRNEYKEFSKTKPEYSYEKPQQLAEGYYGKVEAFDTQKSILKTSKITNTYIPRDIVKEIGIYRLFKEIQCIPKLQGFNFKPDIQLQIEKGVTDVYGILAMVYEGKSLPIQLEDAQKIMLRLAKCLKVISDQGIIHLDLKPENLILTSSNQVQIIDWGLAEIPYNSELNTGGGNTKQTLWWRAPEITLPDQTYNFKADIFSLGIIFIQLYTSNVIPVSKAWSNNEVEYMLRILKVFLDVDVDDYDVFEEMEIFVEGPSSKDRIKDRMLSYDNDVFLKDGFKFDEKFIDLVSGMLDFNPKHRIDYDEIILHPYFQNIKRESVPYLKKYINNMPEIQVKIENRFVYLDIIKVLCDSNMYRNKTLLLAIQLLDLMYHLKPAIKNFLKEYAWECVVIASKLFENEYIKKSNIAVETDIIETLNGNILIPSMICYHESNRSNREKILGYYGRKDVYLKPFKNVVLDNMNYIYIANSIGITISKDEFKLDYDFYVSKDVVIPKDEFDMALNGEPMIYTDDKYRGIHVISLEAPMEGKLPSLS